MAKKQKKSKGNKKTTVNPKYSVANTLKNGREISVDISLKLDVNDNIIFHSHKEIFHLFHVKTNPNCRGFYPIKNTNFALWAPIISKEPKDWNNYINAYGNEIVERYIDKKSEKEIVTKGLYRIVFGHYNEGYKFLGVFMESGKHGKNYFHQKVSNSIIIQSTNLLQIC